MNTEDKEFDLLGIGNALVDVLSKTTDDFIAAEDKAHGMTKGSMNLIDEARAKDLYDKMGVAIEASGGSAANTMAGFASFGGNGVFIGKVAKDQLGDVFAHDMKAIGVHYETERLEGGPETGRCLVLITPDAERTMNTFLGASVELTSDDIDEDLIHRSKITYLEGYLFDPEQAKEAFRQAGDVVKMNNKTLALTLSDSFCVERHRDDFIGLAEAYVDILFANEDEIKSLYRTHSFEESVIHTREKCEFSIITRSEKGSVIVAKDKLIEIPPAPVDKVVDSTGAGDQYAAGFLYGYSQGMPLEKCGQLGSMAASEVISHIGPRPEIKLEDLIKKAA